MFLTMATRGSSKFVINFSLGFSNCNVFSLLRISSLKWKYGWKQVGILDYFSWAIIVLLKWKYKKINLSSIIKYVFKDLLKNITIIQLLNSSKWSIQTMVCLNIILQSFQSNLTHPSSYIHQTISKNQFN